MAPGRGGGKPPQPRQIKLGCIYSNSSMCIIYITGPPVHELSAPEQSTVREQPGRQASDPTTAPSTSAPGQRSPLLSTAERRGEEGALVVQYPAEEGGAGPGLRTTTSGRRAN